MPRLKTDWTEYLHQIRKQEFSIAFQHAHPMHFGKALEIGAGDGFQSSLLKQKSEMLVSSDYNYERLTSSRKNEIQYVNCDAAKLPFADLSFDLVMTSHVLPFLVNLNDVFSEMKRILSKNGLLLHIVPSAVWKLLQISLFYPNLFITLLDSSQRRKALETFQKKAAEQPGNDLNIPSRKDVSAFKKILFPPIVGNYSSHWKELTAFRKTSWLNIFETNGFEVVKIIPLTLFSGYGFGLNRLRETARNMGIVSSYAFWLKIKTR